jgi:PIN domain nuclease of toxin-antitoxin system
VKSVVADTHAVVWYLFEPHKLSKAAEKALDDASAAGDPIVVASISLVEIRYLVEKGKLGQMVLDRVDAEMGQAGSSFRLAPLDLTIARAAQHIPRAAVPDLPDRIIAATAHAFQIPVVSQDRQIRAAPLPVIW